MEKRLDQLFARIYTPVQALTGTAYCSPEPLSFEEKEQGVCIPLEGGTRWGKGWDCAWIRLEGEIPLPEEGKLPALLLDVGGEACLYDENGVPLKGFTNVQSEFTVALGKPAKQAYLLPEAYYGKTVTFWVDCGANDLFGAKPENGIYIRGESAYCNTALRELYYDLEVLAYVGKYAPDEQVRTEAWDCFEKAYASSSRQIAAEFLKKPSVSDFEVTALGHAHLDLAWLWPIRETKRKALRTLSTVVAHMERYPDYKFGVSQPQLLAWVKETSPALYEKLKTLYKEGRLELQGGMWVESDTNLPGGESLVRQLIHGMRFWREEFGFTPEMVWLPDVFGYSAQVPQLMKQAGLPYFLTTKLSWNGVNKFPYASFRWQGIDGSEVLAHMPPEGNYNSAARADSFARAEQNSPEKKIFPGAMLLYGIGDGGGGPGMEHLERLKREKDLLGLPKVKQGFGEDFFRELAPHKEKLPGWKGELYLEKHQGTYTSQGRTKRGNRLCEKKLHEVELLASMALRLRKGYVYPKERMDKIWEEVLLYQFHDILPGSCIARVYKEAEVRYGELLAELDSLKQGLLDLLLTGEGETLFNASSYTNGYPVETANGYLLQKGQAEPLCFTPFARKRGHKMAYSRDFMENSRVRVEFLPDGSIGGIYGGIGGAYGKDSRNYLRGAGNKLQVFLDNEDGWEVPKPEQLTKEYPVKLTSVRTSQKGAALVRTSRYVCGKSVILQQIVLREDCPRIDFVTKVDWKESHRILRASFPMAATAENALCGIQFGAVNRPTTQNTTWEQAKREVCFHKYVDLSDDERGAALLSDCKYGVCLRDCDLSLALLRSPTYPGEGADLGEHTFTYSFYPHRRGIGTVIPEAYRMEYPVEKYQGTCELDVPFVWAKGLCVETVKPAEDGKGVIVRLYNPKNCSFETTVETAEVLGFTSCTRVDLLERKAEPLALQPVLQVKPYEIVTLKFE